MRGLAANASCDALPWDAWPARPPESDNATVRAVIVTHQRGGTGNKLFAVAAGVALSNALQLPLIVPPKVSQTMSSRGFPCLRSSRTLRGIARTRI